ncbi:hypothetical protein PR048_012860 [Dryococelus australis]|uniref:Uncharacterized protein n=1 Tax=Dryococelus australis TaxID=614101 RepID=A0ABQ9HQJ1_9NEOP|nr:hypothetical protein PR048_012860 [Dryococelus australis]
MQYPPSDNFIREVNIAIMETIHTFFYDIILKNKHGSQEKWEIKCTALSHIDISAVWPRSFLSPLQIGAATFLETVLFEVSAIVHPGITIQPSAFSQFVYDNADFNTSTLDRLDTFNAMGGIHCIKSNESSKFIKHESYTYRNTAFTFGFILALWKMGRTSINTWVEWFYGTSNSLKAFFKFTSVPSLPFINAPASDYNTIFTALISAF